MGHYVMHAKLRPMKGTLRVRKLTQPMTFQSCVEAQTAACNLSRDERVEMAVVTYVTEVNDSVWRNGKRS